eukprot:TRINITY_DN448_c0_g1_i22.p1 TRINITY_DN448_c0_g1~~TRINITY_DN448_c0_g1_i22.p1  ORF type:complete len:253 (+),score=42.85 TRINITY_DN448_c0_g1_i22:65-823(+)
MCIRDSYDTYAIENQPPEKEFVFTLSLNVETHEHPFDILITRSGDLYESNFETSSDDAISISYVQDIGFVDNLAVNNYNQVVGFTYGDGQIKVFKYRRSIRKERYSISFDDLDEWNLIENPHGDDVDNTLQKKEFTKQIYRNKRNKVVIEFESEEPNYYAMVEDLRYIFIRNYMTRQVTKRINLQFFPKSLILDRQHNTLIISTENPIYFINLKTKVTEEAYTFLDAPVIHMHYEKKTNKFITVHKLSLIHI